MDGGAHFHKCDFQVHSPRDAQWDGPDCVSDDDRKRYAASLIQACRSKEIDAIAITDHHDLLFARYVRNAAREEPVPVEKRIVVFPGVELTLNVPCQALLIFDSDFPDDMFSLALSALAIMPSASTDAKTIETKRLDHISDLYP
jgi:type III restriction enzyme